METDIDNFIVTGMAMAILFSTNVFASTHEIQIDGETVQVETFGDIEVVDSVYIPMTRGIGNFTFNITYQEKAQTESVNNTYSNWQVQTSGCLQAFDNKYDTIINKSYKYRVSIMDGSDVLFTYQGYNDNGGLTFKNVPKNKNLSIRVDSPVTYPSGYKMVGKGDTYRY